MLNICSLASLEPYAKEIEKLTTQWPRCQGLICMADDAARAERLEKWRRKLTIESAQGRQVPQDWDQIRPWSCILVQVAGDMEFWADRVHHPAAVTEVLQGGPEAEVHHQTGSRKTQANRDRRLVKKRRWAADREELARHRTSSTNQISKGSGTSKGKGKGGGKSRDQRSVGPGAVLQLGLKERGAPGWRM